MSYMFLRFPGFRLRAVTFSYDDGREADRRLVDIFNKNGLKGTFNLNSDCQVPAEEFRSLYIDNGHEVAVHGKRHLPLTSVPDELATEDILANRKKLENATGRIVRGAAYAFGAYDDRIVHILKSCGIVYSRTVICTRNFDIPTDWLRMGMTCHHNDPMMMELADQFFAEPTSPYYYSKSPRLFSVWGHSFEFDNNHNWNVIEDFSAKIGGHDEVWYATNGEIYDYVTAYDRLIFSVDNSMVFNPTSTDIYLSFLNTDVMVPAGGSAVLPKNAD